MVHNKNQRLLPHISDLRTSGTSEKENLLASRTIGSGTNKGKEKDVGTNCATIDICPDILIGAIFAAAAVAFYLLYMAITKAGRRKRQAEKFPLLSQVQDILYKGTVCLVFLPHTHRTKSINTSHCKMNVYFITLS